MLLVLICIPITFPVLLPTLPTAPTIIITEPQSPNPHLSTAAGESMSNAIEIFGSSYTDIRRFQAYTYYKVWVEAGVYLSVSASNGFDTRIRIINSTKYPYRSVENTTLGYYYIAVQQYQIFSPDPNTGFQFPNYTIFIHKEPVHTINLASEILPGETKVSFSTNHYQTRYYKVYVPKNRYFAVSADTLTTIYIYDENLTYLAGNYPLAAEILNTTYTGYYFIEVNRPPIERLGYLGKLDINMRVTIDNPISLAAAEEILPTTTSISFGNYVTKYVKINLALNTFFWMKFPINSSTIYIENGSISYIPFLINTSLFLSQPGYCFIKLMKIDLSLTTLPVEIVIAPAVSMEGEVVTEGTIVTSYPFDGIYPVKYYQITLPANKSLSVTTNISGGLVNAMISESMAPYLENSTIGGTFHIGVGVSGMAICDWDFQGTIQLNFSVDTAHTRVTAYTVGAGVTNVKLPNGNLPYIYYKLNVPPDKFFKLSIDNPMLEFVVMDVNGSVLNTPMTWTYTGTSPSLGGTYYIKINTNSMSGGFFMPSLLYGECQLKIVIDNLPSATPDIITLGNTSGTLDPYGIKQYQVWLVAGLYITVNVVPTAANGSFAFTFATADGTCRRTFESFNYPVMETYYIAQTGYHNITITGRGSYTLILSSAAALPSPPHTMPLSIGDWATNDIFLSGEPATGFLSMTYSPNLIFTGELSYKITNIDYYGGNYIINDTYIISSLLAMMSSIPPPFLPTNYQTNPMGLALFSFGGPTSTPINFRQFWGSVFSVDKSLATYDYKGNIRSAVAYTLTIKGIPALTITYDEATGLLLSIESSNWLFQDMGITKYKVTIVNTNIIQIS
ncbi:MAG: hypothetical protein ACTSRS_12880 [Candidatus Helarchaeota archaeon]